MSKQAKNKSEQEPEESASKALLDNLLSEYSEDHYNAVEPKNEIISTGSLLLDSLVKVRSGGVVRLSGMGAELGKTSESLVLAMNFMATMPKSKTLFVKAEGRLGDDIKKRSGLNYVYTAAEWDFGTVFVLSMNKFERVASIIEDLLPSMHEKGEHLCIIIDSLDGLILVSDAEKNVWGGKESPKVAGVPLLTKLLFRRIALPIVHYDALMIITSQYSAPISLDPYSPTAPRQISGAGGSSAMHQSDYVFELSQRYQGDMILEDPDAKPDMHNNKIIGNWATYQIRKSATDVTGTKVKVPIKKGRIGSCIWVEKEVVDMCLAFGFVSRAGAWFNFRADILKESSSEGVSIKEKIQGLNNLYDYIEQDRTVFNWLYNKFKLLLKNGE